MFNVVYRMQRREETPLITEIRDATKHGNRDVAPDEAVVMLRGESVLLIYFTLPE